jgi:8-oxo-dGTP pyrophosphatase MutT (NUDIX family)
MNGYCSTCGTRHGEPDHWPFTCTGCNTEHFGSPTPVVALVLSAWPKDQGPHGTVRVKRGHSPYKDTLAFPGGPIHHAETWQQAAVRQAREELGCALDPGHLGIRDAVSSNNTLVLFIEHRGPLLTWDNFHQDPITATKGAILDIQVQPGSPMIRG